MQTARDAFDLTLTFDNGPDPAVTPRVLDILAARGLRATFFLVGRKLADPVCRDLAVRAREEGHWLGNHTFSHGTPLGADPDPDVVERELVPTAALVAEAGETRRLFRPFGGGGNLDRRLLKRSVVRRLEREGYDCVLWNAIPRDWADPEGWVDRALSQLDAQPWTLTVLHDLPTGAMDHLERFLDEAAARGVRFRQDFPPDCVPIREGRAVLPLHDFASDPCARG